MKFSTRARYGLRAMVELALNYDQGLVSVRTISQSQGISEAYLEQIMSNLVKSGLVKSNRGVQGGYTLTREPSGILVGEIIRALEGPIVPVECVSTDFPATCERLEKCVSRLVWQKVKTVLDEALNSLSLEDLRMELVKKLTLP